MLDNVVSLTFMWPDVLKALGVFWFWVFMALGTIYLIFKVAASAIYATKLEYMRRLIHGEKGQQK